MIEHESSYRTNPADTCYPKGGVSAQRFEIARHSYLQMKRKQFDAERARHAKTVWLECAAKLAAAFKALRSAAFKSIRAVRRSRPVSG